MSMSVRHRKGHIDVTTRNARIIKQLALCMCAVALFCAGFVVRGNHDLMSRLGIEEPETKAAVQAASADSGEVASRLNEVEGIFGEIEPRFLRYRCLHVCGFGFVPAIHERHLHALLFR